MKYIPLYDKIIPQQFGVRKHPLFFLPSFIIKSNSNKKKIDLSEETQENMINKDKVEINMINSNDDEILSEIKTINSLNSERTNYPLIVEGLTKKYTNDKKEKLALNNLNLLLKNNEIFGLLG
jgi:hypothetical protein